LLQGSSKFDSLHDRTTPRGLKHRTLNRRFSSNQYPRKSITTFRAPSVDRLHGHLGPPFRDYAKIVSIQPSISFGELPETRTPDPLIKSQIQSGPERNIEKKVKLLRARLLFLRQLKVYVLPGFRHRTSTAENSRRERPLPCRRPLPILISTKAGPGR
jgi:hypothetical protein